jgi:hypothetical protein
MLKNKKNILVPALAAVIISGVGTAALSYASASHAATATDTPSTSVQTAGATSPTATTAEPVTANDPADAPSAAPEVHKHAPMGGDGNITAVNGTTITMTEESDEGGASYTIDASKATFDINGTTGSISSLKVGDKIFVQGTTNGTSVAATSVSVGHHGHRGN